MRGVFPELLEIYVSLTYAENHSKAKTMIIMWGAYTLNTVLVFSCVEVSSHYSTEEVCKVARIKELAINVEVCDGQLTNKEESHGIERTLLHLIVKFRSLRTYIT
jgi:hypothetical protein